MSKINLQSTGVQATDAGHAKGYILTKLTAGRIRHYFSGTLEAVEVADGGHAMIGKSGLLPGDAFVFGTEGFPTALAKFLNDHGIGGADWEVQPAPVEIASPA